MDLMNPLRSLRLCGEICYGKEFDIGGFHGGGQNDTQSFQFFINAVHENVKPYLDVVLP